MLDILHSAGGSSVDLCHDSCGKKHIHEVRENRDCTVRSIRSTVRSISCGACLISLTRFSQSNFIMLICRESPTASTSDHGVAVVQTFHSIRTCMPFVKVNDYTIILAVVKCSFKTHHIR